MFQRSFRATQKIVSMHGVAKFSFKDNTLPTTTDAIRGLLKKKEPIVHQFSYILPCRLARPADLLLLTASYYSKLCSPGMRSSHVNRKVDTTRVVAPTQAAKSSLTAHRPSRPALESLFSRFVYQLVYDAHTGFQYFFGGTLASSMPFDAVLAIFGNYSWYVPLRKPKSSDGLCSSCVASNSRNYA